MIAIIDTMRRGYAVYWPPVKDEQGRILVDRNGNPRYDDPVELTPDDGTGVFWMDQNELIVDGTGQQRMSKSRVYIGFDADLNGVLFNGRLADVPPSLTNDPLRIPKIAQIIAFNRLPTLTYDQFVRVCFL